MTDQILTSYVYPPIPVRDFDYQAFFDSYDGAPDSGWQCEGSGRTEYAAVLDMYDNWETMRDEPLVAHRPGFMEDLYA